MEVISSKTNKTYIKYKSLRQKKFREMHGLFIVEGYKLVTEALESSFEVEMVIVSEASSYGPNFPGAMVLKNNLFDDLSLMESPEGIMAVVKMKDKSHKKYSNRLICLDRVADPGNMGTIIRTCDSFGFKDLLLMPGCVDIYNPKVLRASMGSAFRVNIHFVENKDIEDLQELGYDLVSSSLEDSQDLRELVLNDKYILVLGSESHGIGEFFKNHSNKFVKIPISPEVDSLNVAIAAAVIMYELSSR